jgi:hypothetical protein
MAGQGGDSIPPSAGGTGSGLPVDPLILASTSTVAVGLQVTGDTADELQITPGGINFGSGSAPVDTTLYRTAPGVLAAQALTLTSGVTALQFVTPAGNNLYWPASGAAIGVGGAGDLLLAITPTGGHGVLLGLATTLVAFFGGTPVGQAAAIAQPTGGATIDTQARTAINSILAAIGAAAGGIGITA